MSYERKPERFKRAHVTSTPQRRGLDDGPPLPSPQALERAYAKIESKEFRTDTNRLNWMESQKYFIGGIGFDGKRFSYEILLHQNGMKKPFYGRSVREAIDNAMDWTRSNKTGWDKL